MEELIPTDPDTPIPLPLNIASPLMTQPAIFPPVATILFVVIFPLIVAAVATNPPP